ncbi:hypothetical protein GF314_01535 [bacterium]|nr:hypothetical protein [bacterium]
MRQPPATTALSLTLALVLAATAAHAQCSDAGLCLVGDHATRVTADHASPQHTADLTYRLGVTGDDDDLVVHSVELGARLALTDRTGLAIRLPYRSSDGEQGSASGPGDALVLLEQAIVTSPCWTLGLAAGARLATGDDDAEPDLPQAYQPGLGATDLILAATARHRAWSFALGYQLVEDTFTGNETTPIRRGDDLYLQVARAFTAGGFDLTAEVQAIQRLAATEIRLADDTTIEVEDSDRLQINLGLEARRSLIGRLDLAAGVAVPLVSRDQNVDGLQRALTVSVGLATGF